MYRNQNYIPAQYSGATPAVLKKWVLEIQIIKEETTFQACVGFYRSVGHLEQVPPLVADEQAQDAF